MTERILMSGNEAMAEAAIRAGLDAYFGYPITPQNEVPAYMSKKMPEEGRVFLQSESELAAVNMVFGAAATGKRVMTSSSSPGISLMQEGISYLAGAELPSVIVNIMRGGPGLGNIAPSQGDYFQSTRGGGHGDYRTPVLAPGSIQEMVDFMPLAFDIADNYRTPVMVIAEGTLGQMMEPITLPEYNTKPPVKKDWALTGKEGREQNIVRSLWLGESVLEKLNYKLKDKYEEITKNEVRFEEYKIKDADVIVIGYGIVSRIAKAAIDELRQQGLKVGLFRPITLWPFPMNRLEQLAKENNVFLTVEMSNGQMIDDVKIAVGKKVNVEFFGRPAGGIPTVEQVMNNIKRVMPS